MLESFRRDAEAGALFGSMDLNTRKEKKKKDKQGKKAGKRGRVGEAHSRKGRLAAVASDLARLDATLAQLRMRVGDLHAVQLDHEETGSVLLTRLDDLSERLGQQARQGATAAERGAEARQRLETLSAAVDALRAEADVILEGLAQVAVQPDRDTALFALEDRIQGTEELLAALQGSLDELYAHAEHVGEPDARLAEIDSFGRRLDEAATALRAHAERLGAVEQDLDEVQARVRAESAAGEERWVETLGRFSAGVDQRLGELERDLGQLRVAAVEQREGERAWVEDRLQVRGRRRTAGLSAFGVLALALLAAGWWHTEARLGETVKGLAALDARTAVPAVAGPGETEARPLVATLQRLDAAIERADNRDAMLAERLAALAAPQDAVADDLLARLRRLEETQADLQRAAAEEALGAAALDAGMKAVAADRDGLGRLLAQTRAAVAGVDGRLAVLETRIEGLSRRPVDAALAGLVSPGPITLPAERFAIQLIGFRQPASVEPFARRFGIAREARYMRSRFQGRDWYVVLLGDYASREEGVAAAEGLSAELRELDPWVRPLKAGSRLIPID